MLLKQLQYFMAVAECRHFTRAADRLFVSQSALSQQITKLENDLGVKLINRLSHPIELTPAGRDFMAYAKNILAEVADMQKQMQKHLPVEKSTLYIGTINGLGSLNFAEILADFNRVHANISLSITNKLSKELCRLLKEGSLDLALFAAPYHIEEYNFDLCSLEEEEFVLIVPSGHALAGRETVALAETKNEPFIFPTPDNVSYDVFMSECAASGFVPQVVSECNGPGRRIDLVAAGLGIALISSSGLSYYTASKISILHLVRPFYKRIVLARAKRASYPPPLAALWNHILHCDKKRRAAHP